MKLPTKLSALRTYRAQQTAFKGLSSLPFLEEGELRNCCNMTTKYYPYLVTRNRRRYADFLRNGEPSPVGWTVAGDNTIQSLTGHWTITQGTDRFFVELHTESGLGAGGEIPDMIESMQGGFRRYAMAESMAGKMVVFPSVPDANWEMVPSKSTLYYGVPGDGHSGDPQWKSVELTGMVLFGGVAFNNNLYCFGRQYDKEGTSSPMIVSSALGEPTDFVTPEGGATTTSAYRFLVPVDSDFTAIFQYRNNVYYFTAEEMFQIYGTDPTNYTSQKIHNFGCQSMRSITEVGGVLYFSDGKNVYAFTGGSPVKISGKLDLEQSEEILLGGGEDILYLAVKNTGHKTRLFTYTTNQGVFSSEDVEEILCFFQFSGFPMYSDGERMVNLDGLFSSQNIESTIEPPVRWEVETGYYTKYYYASNASVTYSEKDKRITRVLVRLHVKGPAELSVAISTDDGEYKTVYSRGAVCSGCVEIPVSLKPCDRFSVRLNGTGPCELVSIVKEMVGSE